VNLSSWRNTFRGLLPNNFIDSLDETDCEERWSRFIGSGRSKVFVVDGDNGVVGFASAGRERVGVAGLGGELYAIYVIDSVQRRGFGLALVLTIGPKQVEHKASSSERDLRVHRDLSQPETAPQLTRNDDALRVRGC
jgi:GNAT superfamily N-acetyltransferase